jgi:hypothetical protein
MKAFKHKYILTILIVLWTLVSCQQQDVLTSIEGSSGVLEVEFEDNSPSFGEVSPDIAYDKTVTLSNKGTFAISNIEISGLFNSLKYKDGFYPGTGGNCGTTIPASSSCTIVLEYFTEDTETNNSTFDISYNDGINTLNQSYPIYVNAAYAASLIIAEDTYTTAEDIKNNSITTIRFPRVTVGAFSSSTISLYNNGGRPLTLDQEFTLPAGIAFAGGDFPGDGGTCKRVIAPQEICKLSFEYYASEVGQKTENVLISFFNGISSTNTTISFFTDTIDERGNIFIGGSGTINMGSVTETATRTIFVTFTNPTVLQINDLAMTLTNNQGGLNFTGGIYPGTSGSCGTTLNALSTCRIELEFSSAILGNHNEAVNVTYNDNHLLSPQVENKVFPVQIEVLTTADIGLREASSIPSTTPNNFGVNPVSTTLNHVFSFENTGGSMARLVQVELINNPDDVFSITPGGSCGTSLTNLNTDQRCTVRVKAYSTTKNDYTADLKISYDNGTGDGSRNETLIIPLTISYVDIATLTYTPGGSVNFGETLNGTTTPTKTITITNVAQGDASSVTMDTAGLAATPFEIESTSCGATIAGTASCDINFQASPTIISNYSFNFVIQYSDLTGTKSIPINLRVNALATAELVGRDQDGITITSFDFEDSPINENSSRELQIRNTGGITAKNIDVSFSSPVFTISDEGTCPSLTDFTLGGSSGCSMEIQFTPTAALTYNETITISYHDGAGLTNKTYPITGRGDNSGLLIMAGAERYPDTNVMSIGTTVAGVPLTKVLTFENIGTADVSGFTPAPLTGDFSWGTNTCNNTIAPSTTCTIEVIYSPVNQGGDQAIVDYTYNSSQSIKRFTFGIRANAQSPPDIKVAFTGPNQPDSYDYKKVPYLVTEYLNPINISNLGSADATNFNITLDQGTGSSFAFTTNCPTGGGTLSGGGLCQVSVSYSPEDKTVHTASLSINYDGYGNESLPITVGLKGEGVNPLADFGAYTQIYAATGNVEGEIKIAWDAATSTAPGITVDGYKIYKSEGTPLPSTVIALEPYEVEHIASDTVLARKYEITGVPADTTVYIAIRPTYLGQVMDTSTNTSNLIIMMPPENMALVHPYVANREFCEEVGLPLLPDKNYGCEFTGDGNTGGYYDFGKYLYVDRYELSLDVSSTPQTVAGAAPETFLTAYLAQSACNDFTLDFQAESRFKRLLTRSEYFRASAWDPSLTSIQIAAIEKEQTTQDCVNKQTNPIFTGSRSKCVSRYGIYDLVGNVWEWNSDQTFAANGIDSTVDFSNKELGGVSMAGLFFADYVDQPCFNYALGIVQPEVAGSCPMGLKISDDTKLFEDVFFFAPLASSKKAVRSGGSTGSGVSIFDKLSGRYALDMNTPATTAREKTGARCGFSISF